MIRVLMLIFYSSLLFGCQKAAQEVLILTQEASYSASLSHDASLAIVSTARQGVQVWDLKQKRIKYTWHQGEGKSNVIATALSANAAYAATLTNQSLGLWSLDTGESVGWWSLPASGQTVAVANTGQALVGLVDGSVLSLAHDRQSLIKFLGHTEKVTSVSVSADGQYALSGGNDAQVILWHAHTGQPIQRWQLASRVTKVLLNDDASISFASDIMGNASLWHSQSGKLKTHLDIKRRQMTFSAARFIDQDKYLLTGTPSKEMFLWHSQSGKKIARRQVQVTKDNQNRGAVVYSVARQSPRRLVSISSQGLLESWDLQY
jgi:WD40 repeat protein